MLQCSKPEVKSRIGLLDKWAAEAIKADPVLLDRDKVAEQIYRKRYGDKRWKAMVERCAKTGATPSWELCGILGDSAIRRRGLRTFQSPRCRLGI